MNTETLSKHLETLAGHVFDNDKLVTYKWLSKELQIHVNVAKQILWEFYQKYRMNNIECTYLLIGLLKDADTAMRIEVVKDSVLSKAKEKFSKIISEHLYSVHKPLADLNQLANFGSGDVNYSAIKCDVCKERSDEEMQLLRWGTAAKKPTIQDKISTDSINSLKSENNSVTSKKNKFNNFFNMPGKSKPEKSPEKLKSSCQEKNQSSMNKDEKFCKEKNSTKMSNLMEKNEVVVEKRLTEEEKDHVEKDKDSLEKDKVFSKNKDSTEKNKGSTKRKKDSKVNSTAKKVSPKSNSIKKEGLDNFFGKFTSPPKPTEAISSEEKNDKAEKKFNEKEKSKEKDKLPSRKRNRSKETDKGAKKRKRVFIQSDSSDSEEHSDVEMEESIPEPEPEAPARPKSPSPPRMKHENGKRKVLKLVNRTYKEGEYIVTKKEHVYVSCSEDEEEKKGEEKRKDIKKVEAKMEKVKKKQSTLTDFFKKS